MIHVMMRTCFLFPHEYGPVHGSDPSVSSAICNHLFQNMTESRIVWEQSLIFHFAALYLLLIFPYDELYVTGSCMPTVMQTRMLFSHALICMAVHCSGFGKTSSEY